MTYICAAKRSFLSAAELYNTFYNWLGYGGEPFSELDVDTLREYVVSDFIQALPFKDCYWQPETSELWVNIDEEDDCLEDDELKELLDNSIANAFNRFEHSYQIYQISDDCPKRNELLFTNLKGLENAGYNVEPENYTLIWEDSINDNENLDSIFTRFNAYVPDDFPGHSLSVSDVVVLGGVPYFCDSYGWKKLSAFDRGKCNTDIDKRLALRKKRQI